MSNRRGSPVSMSDHDDFGHIMGNWLGNEIARSC